MLLFAFLFMGYRHATSKLAKFAVGCGTLLIPAAIYNWMYGWPALSAHPSTLLIVLGALGFAGIFLSAFCGGIALILEALKDGTSLR
jgi:hypothetical protein